MMKRKTLWIRKLSCGHERATNIAFINGKYDRPQKGVMVFCRECMHDVKIIGVRKATRETQRSAEEDLK